MITRPPLEPRKYQDADLRALLAGDYRTAAIVYGVGGGKTPTGLILGHLWLLDGTCMYMIVVTTQRAIARQFTSYSDPTNKFGGKFRFDGQVHSFPKAIVNRNASGKQLRDYLARDNPERKMVVVCGAALLNEVESLEQAMREGKRILLIIDEGHHAHDTDVDDRTDASYVDDTELSKALDRLRRQGAELRLVKLTGTPYRSDNKPVVDQVEFRCNMRLITLMQEGYAPKQVLTQYRQIKGDYRAAATQLAAQWIEDGRPSVVIRIKPRNKSINKATVKAIMKAFAELPGAPSATVYDTTLEEGADRLGEALEKNEHGALEKHAVFITINRMVEGVDVQTLTHAYFWGVPRSMLVIEQILGRILRLRIDAKDKPIPGCPAEWAMKSKAVFFFGNSFDRDEDEDEFDYTRLVLRALVFMSTFEHPAWLNRQILGIDDGVPCRLALLEPQETVEQEQLVLAKEMLACFKHAWDERIGQHAALSWSMVHTPKKFVTAFVEWYKTKGIRLRRKDDPILSDGLLQFALYHQRRESLTPEGRAKLHQALERMDDPMVRDVFDELAPGFRADYYRDGFFRMDGDGAEDVGGGFVKKMTERLEGSPKTPDELLSRIEIFRLVHGRWPDTSDVDPGPSKTLKYSYYTPLLRAHGYASLDEFICLTRSNPREQLLEAWDYARSAGRGQVKEGLERLRRDGASRGNPFSELFAEQIMLGAVRLGWRSPPVPLKGDAQQIQLSIQALLSTLKGLRAQYATTAGLDVVKKTYRSRDFEGVRALVNGQAAAE